MIAAELTPGNTDRKRPYAIERIGLASGRIRVMLIPMVDVLILLWTALTSLFCSRVPLEAEIVVLRQQQINVLRRIRRKG